jgi:hypothetical protein
MRGEFNTKMETGGPINRIIAPATPGTPTVRSPAYQRSGSNDSGKSSEH